MKYAIYVYIAYFTELILQICDYAQKRRIWRKNCKYALDKNFHFHFCSRRKAAKFCHPDPHHPTTLKLKLQSDINYDTRIHFRWRKTWFFSSKPPSGFRFVSTSVLLKEFWTKKRILEISQAFFIQFFSGGHCGGPCWRSDKAILAYPIFSL